MSGNTPADRDRLTIQVFAIAQRIMSALFKSDLKAEEVEKAPVQEIGMIAQEVCAHILSRLRGLGDGCIIADVISSNEIELMPLLGVVFPLYLVRPMAPGQSEDLVETLAILHAMGYEPTPLAPEKIGKCYKDLWRSRIKSMITIDIEGEAIYQLDIYRDDVSGHMWGMPLRKFTGKDWILATKR